MSDLPSITQDDLIRRLSRDLADGYDEELEMEVEDREHLPPGGRGGDDRRRETGLPAPVLLRTVPVAGGIGKAAGLGRRRAPEGRDPLRGPGCAGKGGAIKRITQRLNPRVCRVVALPGTQ